MGICSSVNNLPQILVLGLDGAGKTTFLYADKWENFEPTIGFNYEEIQLRGIVKVSVWDVSGKETVRCLWPTLYKNIFFHAVVFVIDVDKPERFFEAQKEILVLVNEEELRESAFLVVFNTRKSEFGNLEEMNLKVGIDLVHQLVRIKTVVTDLMHEDEEFDSALLWLCEQIDR